ncbi:hydroxypyruvate isomerase family protein [Sphingobacterium psychroaquaticum]|uniref:Hydroxypyruvate isomerase n=1 Tax=Sphingobacterium psychroaquaticum TaxID=561061 RepID=A0A1X7JSI8_9SPHI|nr:TIM barrel protein [Sphingobacterium psychroaquaticum]QBQ41057.1 xylose isomerase [Sphingobacterium psychroaquaticum]SMG31112.1 hydroxypyruvate isomerase [Sphingobacterium psychroaquaticum]
MKRSDFIKNGAALLGSTVLLNNQTMANEQLTKNATNATFKLDYAPHQGMFSATAGKNFLDEIKYMYDLGFRSIEDNGMPGRSVEDQTKVGELLAKLGMRMGVFVVPKGGNGANTLAAGKKEHVDIFLNGIRQSIEIAKRVNAKWITVVPGDYQRNLPIGVQTANVIEGLKRGAELLEPHGVTMVLEPLSDTPDLFLRYTDQTYEICKAVGSPSCKILYDAYHQQKNEGNLINLMNLCWSEIAYVQVGDNPGRREPTTGEINYKNVFKWLKEKGYTGIVGMEHGMSKSGVEGEKALVAAYREVDNF